jgi:kynurenine formamidase
MAETDERFVFDPILERDGVKVSRSPWGPDDEIGRLNWITPESRREILERLDGRGLFELSVDFFNGMPSWDAAGDPKYDSWMTHTGAGSRNDDIAGLPPEVFEKTSYCGDAITMYTHCGTHIDTLTHIGHYGCYWNGWTEAEHLGSRGWLKGGADKYPTIVARGVLIDVAGAHGVDCLPDSYTIQPSEIETIARDQGVQFRRGDVVLINTGRMSRWPDHDGYLLDPPGICVATARWLCEDAGAMCIGSDTVCVEVIPAPDGDDPFVPVHAYMFATAGAQLIEICFLEELAAEKLYEFAFIGGPLRLRGTTGSPFRPIAVPLKS